MSSSAPTPNNTDPMMTSSKGYLITVARQDKDKARFPSALPSSSRSTPLPPRPEV
ncbi:hypothetical protein [uncultured Microbacterium sp.]|uniref:hypothetical protein n=1 Tax=uncultured Microbacterium sp. TaxID=191216 RepID=UPI0032B10763